MKGIFIYEWKRLLRSKVLVAAWLTMLLIGAYGLYCGYEFRTDQVRTAYQIDTAYRSRVNAQLGKFRILDTVSEQGKKDYKSARDPFLNEYALQVPAVKRPAPLQAMAIGQADNNIFYYNTWIAQSIYSSKTSEIRNPAKLKAGNFDLSFVIIYLFPLLIIACTHDVVGEDRQTGADKLIVVQGRPQWWVSAWRIFFRAGAVTFLALLLSAAGAMLTDALWTIEALVWMLVTLIYLTFWAALCFFIVNLTRTSSLSALVMVSVWILFLFLVPSLIHRGMSKADLHGVEMAEVEREFSYRVWGMDPDKLRDTLVMLRPAWKSYDLSDEREIKTISYYTILASRLSEVGSQRDEHILSEEETLRWFTAINPGFAAQFLFNRLGGSEASDFVRFRRAAAAFQIARMDHVNYYRLSKEAFTRQAFVGSPGFRSPKPHILASQWMAGLSPLLLLSAGFIVLGIYVSEKTSRSTK
ncbi:ABC transporter permease [Pedobacter deserti]|uniref:ABC transporter permease n=1 Tax=Pedobacter deserti TaxID=2817382 RepID=UPI00210E3295|nr:ABC transporter permease subunit [Pedobacter sp. SYSU D00382]